jgi:hypothetical protein
LKTVIQNVKKGYGMGIGKKEKPKPFLKYELPYAKPS